MPILVAGLSGLVVRAHALGGGHLSAIADAADATPAVPRNQTWEVVLYLYGRA